MNHKTLQLDLKKMEMLVTKRYLVIYNFCLQNQPSVNPTMIKKIKRVKKCSFHDFAWLSI